MKDKPRAILRADANEKIGYGHVIRCLSIAEMIRDDYQCVLVTSQPNQFIINESQKIGIQIIKIPYVQYKFPDNKGEKEELSFDLASILTGNEIVVTDGYWFGINYQQEVKRTGAKLICIDDYAHVDFVADAIINHSPGVDANTYCNKGNSQLYLGLNYALIRDSYLNARKTFTEQNRFRFTISLGASDPHKIGPFISELLVLNVDEPITLISPHKINISSRQIERVWGVPPEDLIEIYSTTNIAIVSSSSTLFETLLFNTRSITGYFTENQQLIYKGFKLMKQVYGLGSLIEREKIKTKLESLILDNWNPVPKPLNTIDGKSPERVRKLFKEI